VVSIETALCDHLVITIGARNTQFEVTYRVFGRDQYELAQLAHISQGVKVLG